MYAPSEGFPALVVVVVAIVQTFALMLKPTLGRLPISEVCEDFCECDNILLKVDCTGVGLKRIPDIRNNTRALVFDLNDLNVIEKTDFFHLRNLRYISLINNTIDEIQINSFKFQRKVVKLDLSGNRFGEVPVALEHLRILKELQLSNNQIRTLSKEPWSNLTRLRRLNLDNNGVPNLPVVMTSKLKNLQELSVSHNNISAIPAGQFLNMSNLKYLDLSYNEITTNVQSSYESYGPVTYASDFPTAATDLEYAVDNMAEGIVVNSFRGLTQLKVLNLKGNNIQQLIKGVLNDMESLHTLHLDENGMEHIEEDVFRGHLSLRYLSLSSNMLTVLPLTLFEDLRNLQVLILDFNYISDLSPLTNVHMFHMKKLSLNNNRITNIPPPGFKQYFALEELYLNHNKLTELPVVQNLTNLTVLDVGNNRIRKIWPINAFEGTSVQQLIMPYNRFQTLDLNTFAYLPNLQLLDVSGNNYICDCQLNWVVDLYEAYYWMTMPDGNTLDQTIRCHSPPLLYQLSLYDRFYLGMLEPLKCTEYADPHRVMLLIVSWGGVVAFFLLIFWIYTYFNFKKRFYVRKPKKRYILLPNKDKNASFPLTRNQGKVRFRSIDSDTESLDMLNCNFDEETTV